MRLSRKLRARLGYKVEFAGAQWGWSRSESYRAVARGDIPVERHGKLLLVPKRVWDAKVRRMRRKLGETPRALRQPVAEAAVTP